MKRLVPFISVFLASCITLNPEEPTTVTTPVVKPLVEINKPASPEAPFYVAVYQFSDKTGQRRPSEMVAHLSSAVTQGGETWLIKALQDAGNGSWFRVVERVGLENLTRERQLIRQTREQYEGKDAKPLAPLQFAGIIMEGGIIGYDSSTESGGAAYRWLGIGPQTQYSKDIVTISLRAVSVNTGKVLATVTIQKTILSTSDSLTALKFYDLGTKAFEAEAGLTINEPTSLAVKATVEAGVVELIKEGQRKGIWDYRMDPDKLQTGPFQPDEVKTQPVISSEMKEGK